MNKLSITRSSGGTVENVVNVISQGSNIDELKEVFVTREAPDNAIQRIETLENQVKELMKANMPKIVQGNSDGLAAAKNTKDLQKRLQALEEKSESHDQSIADLQAALSALKDASATVGDSKGPAADNSNFKTQIHAIYEELKKMATKDDLNHQADMFDKKIKNFNEKVSENRNLIDLLRKDQSAFNHTYETFIETSFKSVAERTTTLEKKVSALFAKKSNRGNTEVEQNNTPIADGDDLGDDLSDLADRVAELEQIVRSLRDRPSHSFNDHGGNTAGIDLSAL